VVLRWYTAQPDPSRWVAVGAATSSGVCVATHMYVGVGRSESAATLELLRSALPADRILDGRESADDACVSEWSL
jgi:hypothetical protein